MKIEHTDHLMQWFIYSSPSIMNLNELVCERDERGTIIDSEYCKTLNKNKADSWTTWTCLPSKCIIPSSDRTKLSVSKKQIGLVLRQTRTTCLPSGNGRSFTGKEEQFWSDTGFKPWDNWRYFCKAICSWCATARVNGRFL